MLADPLWVSWDDMQKWWARNGLQGLLLLSKVYLPFTPMCL
jgi:hypothetical protein